jgi:hypothetical protein
MRIMLLGGIINALSVLSRGKNTSIEKVSTDISSSVYPFLCKIREKQQQERRLNRIEKARKQNLILTLTRVPPSDYYSKEKPGEEITSALAQTDTRDAEFVEIPL